MAAKNQLTKSDYLPYSEYVRLLDCLHSDKLYIWELYAVLAFCTACRSSDVRKLKWSEVLNQTNITITEQKTGKTRKIYFNKGVRERISNLYSKISPTEDGLIFENEKTGKPITIQCVNQKLKMFKMRYRLRIGNFSTHTFRKTFGRYVYELNNRSSDSLILLNQIFKHANLEITKIYIGITQDEINQIYSSIKL